MKRLRRLPRSRRSSGKGNPFMPLAVAGIFFLFAPSHDAMAAAIGSTTREVPAARASAASADWERVAGRVRIRRDTYGIPHILGEDRRAAYFGFGYAQAEDHMEHIARALLRARGEAARYFGRDEIENDFSMRRLDNLAEAGKDLQRVTPEFRDIIQAYAAGLNRYVRKHASELPGWVTQAGTFTAADVMALIRSRSVYEMLSPRIRDRLSEKYGDGAEEKPGARGAVEGPGSNAFALAGSRTSGGSPILLASPHLMWSSLYWEAQITVPGEMDFFGNTLAGYPVLWAGFNSSLGWANTVNHADLDDIYALDVAPEHPDSYVLDGQRRRMMTKRVEVIYDNGNGKLEKATRTYRYTDLGPVIYRTADRIFAVKSARLDAPVSFEGFYRLSRTHNLEEFKDVFRHYPVFSCNFIYADKDGNILYLWQAMLPKRDNNGTDYSLDVPLHSQQEAWSDLHAFGDMPKLENPAHGVVINSNNPPWWASPRDWIDPKDYPSYYESGGLALRPQLAMMLLDEKEKYSVQDVLDVTFNTRMLLAERVLPDLLAVLRTERHASEEAEAAWKTLAGWDRHVSRDSHGAVLFKRFWDTYARELAQPFALPWDPAKPTITPRGLADKARAVRHVEQAVRWTREHYGKADVAWGEVHRLRSHHLDLPGDGADGSYGTFHVLRYADARDGKKVAGRDGASGPLVGFGSNWIMLVEFGPTVRAWSVLASGESGNFASRHSEDQLELFQAHELRPIWFSSDDIRHHAESVYHP